MISTYHSRPFDGLVVAVSEHADDWYLKKMREMVEGGGGRLVDQVDARTTHLVVPESTTRELARHSRKVQAALALSGSGSGSPCYTSTGEVIWIVYDTWVWLSKKNQRRENEAPYDAHAGDRPKVLPPNTTLSNPSTGTLDSFDTTWRVYNFMEQMSAEAERFHVSFAVLSLPAC